MRHAYGRVSQILSLTPSFFGHHGLALSGQNPSLHILGHWIGNDRGGDLWFEICLYLCTGVCMYVQSSDSRLGMTIYKVMSKTLCFALCNAMLCDGQIHFRLSHHAEPNRSRPKTRRKDQNNNPPYVTKPRPVTVRSSWHQSVDRETKLTLILGIIP